MKPLTPTESLQLLERTQSFQDSEITSINILSANEISLEINTQDKSRAFDWIKIVLHFKDVIDAKLIQNTLLLDMSEGATIFFENENIIFGVGNYKNYISIKDSVLFLEALSIKIEEFPFS
jgi:hypothetical protein